MGFAMLRRPAVAAIALSSVLMGASASMASLLPVGGTVVPGATASPGGATQLASTGAVNFVALVDPTAYNGTLTTSVYNNDAGNPFGAAGLTFTYLLTNSPNSRDNLERFVANNFTGYQVDVGTNGAGRAPATADRNAPGDGVGWDWSGVPAVAPGTNSTLLVLHTNAVQFIPTTDNIINAFPALAASLGPAPVPEPASLGVLMLSGLALSIRRRGAK